MDRRTFIGSVIGFLAVTRVPFVARAAVLRRSVPSLLDLSKFRLAIDPGNGAPFWAPAWERTTRDHAGVRWCAKTLELTRDLEVRDCTLVDPNGVPLFRDVCHPDWPRLYQAGETMRFFYCMGALGNGFLAIAHNGGDAYESV